MQLSEMTVVVGTAHRRRLRGKQSPDGRLREYAYSRRVAAEVCAALRQRGCKCEVDLMDADLPRQMQAPVEKVETQRELAMRVNLVNELCRQQGAGRVLYVSIHNDAIGTDGKWHDCGGWSCLTTPGTTKSDLLAECLYDAAEVCLGDYKERFAILKKQGVYGKKQQPIRTNESDGDRDFESGLKVLRGTQCPAVLTENLFQDNRKDVDFLLTDAGRQAIVALHVEGIVKYIESL